LRGASAVVKARDRVLRRKELERPKLSVRGLSLLGVAGCFGLACATGGSAGQAQTTGGQAGATAGASGTTGALNITFDPTSAWYINTAPPKAIAATLTHIPAVGAGGAGNNTGGYAGMGGTATRFCDATGCLRVAAAFSVAGAAGAAIEQRVYLEAAVSPAQNLHGATITAHVMSSATGFATARLYLMNSMSTPETAGMGGMEYSGLFRSSSTKTAVELSAGDNDLVWNLTRPADDGVFAVGIEIDGGTVDPGAITLDVSSLKIQR
jgi:hypothetical protein